MTQTTGGPDGSDAPDSTTGTGEDGGRSQAGREWLTQLQSMIDNVTTAAAPVMRDVAAKAAELAAAAGERAGPIAHKAADATEAAGQRLAERGREVAAEIRRSKDGGNGEGAAAGDPPNAIDRPPVRDSADTAGE